MRRVCGSMLMLAIVAFVACAAPAPEAPPLRGLVSTRVVYLSTSQVQEELKLSEDQVKQIEEVKAKWIRGFAGLRGLDKEERARKLEDINKADEAALAKILTRKQLKRAEQIFLQRRGPMTWSMPSVAAALKLTDEQKEKMAVIQKEWEQELREKARANEQITPQERREMGKKRDEKLLNVLTPVQKTKWKELQGEPFKWESRPKGPKQPDQGSDRPALPK